MHHLLLAEVFPAGGEVGGGSALQLQRPYLVIAVLLGQPVLRVLDQTVLYCSASRPVLVLPPLRLRFTTGRRHIPLLLVQDLRDAT